MLLAHVAMGRATMTNEKIGWWKRHFHICKGKMLAVSYFTVTDPGSTDLMPGTNTNVICRCDICNRKFVNQYPGKWTLEELKAK
jgi:hypothetical protein